MTQQATATPPSAGASSASRIPSSLWRRSPSNRQYDLRDLQRQYGLTYLFISHSMPLVRYLCDRVAVMQRGRLVELGECEQVCEEPAHEYTRRLIAVTPEMPGDRGLRG